MVGPIRPRRPCGRLVGLHLDDPGGGAGCADPGEAGRRVVQARRADVVGVTYLALKPGHSDSGGERATEAPDGGPGRTGGPGRGAGTVALLGEV
jgi:hypothetical protein